MTDRTNYCTSCKERQDRIEAQAAEIERLRKALTAIANGEVDPSIWPDLAVRYERFSRATLGETE
jgi:hypothetical protein